jgi:hypothetical protein
VQKNKAGIKELKTDWRTAADGELYMAKELADGRLSQNILAFEVLGRILDLVPSLKSLDCIQFGSIKTRAGYLRKQLETKARATSEGGPTKSS